ncbi:urease accessory protein [Rhodospirillaceae bacterium KN72]|uniref:Urease accessory protein UreD n=1 Tax=Pacificispira spongiicola TaxID=2729598 RepID=A0A7Y0E2T8_9PROT|nr:urease accessory protein UreD [Pacificispira spongiicola]NMM46169.1 urease accessory protein [Pacificispira spongiicola]
MYDGTLQSNLDAPPALQRAKGVIRLDAVTRAGKSRLGNLYQSGCGKVRFPRIYDHSMMEAVIINTAGGLTGGDRFDVTAGVGPDAALRLSGQACERLYRRRDGQACMETRLSAADNADLHWLPQETILFDGSALSRRLFVDLAVGARFIGLEATVFGRAAMGETSISARFRESWRLRIDGKLVYADEAGLDGDLTATLSRATATLGATCTVGCAYVGPDPEAFRDLLRAEVPPQDGLDWGCSLRRGVLVCRAVAEASGPLRLWIADIYRILSGGLSLPRPWYC